jgi:hypothetical protein
MHDAVKLTLLMCQKFLYVTSNYTYQIGSAAANGNQFCIRRLDLFSLLLRPYIYIKRDA